MSVPNPSEGRLGHLSQYSTCCLVRAGYCTQLKSSATITTTGRALLLHVCTTLHAWCLQTTTRMTRVLLYTRNTRTLPHGRHVCYCTRTPRNDRSEHARAPYTWARPPTCTPCRPPDHQLMRASVVMLQYPRALAIRGHTSPRVHRIRPSGS